jgi:hypothetical protein
LIESYEVAEIRLEYLKKSKRWVGHNIYFIPNS